MDPTQQNPQAIQAMIAALQANQGQAVPASPQAVNQPYMNPSQQQASLGNGAAPPGYGGMLNTAPPMTPPPAPIY